MSKKII